MKPSRSSKFAAASLAILIAGCSGSTQPPPVAAGLTHRQAAQAEEERARRASSADPSRKITAQDCTKPLSGEGGNLMCR
jgi:hypothetical protein